MLARKVTGVNPDGAAYAAGLRDGMALGGWSIYGGDISKNIELTVVEGDKRTSIKFFPVSKIETVTPQFYLKPNLSVAARRECLH